MKIEELHGAVSRFDFCELSAPKFLLAPSVRVTHVGSGGRMIAAHLHRLELANRQFRVGCP